MHKAQVYLEQLIAGPPKLSNIETYSINNFEARTLYNCLQSDAISYFYSATVSIGDAIRGIRQQLISWATVKLYYATFYACRAMLALERVGIFYIGKKPYTLEVQPGSTAQKRKGQTHKIVLDEFRNRGTEPRLLSQPIEYYSNPLDWLMEKREEANYRNAKFWEPSIPAHFEKIISIGVRKAISTYLSDTKDIYLFDPDHAILAYPITTLQITYQRMKASGSSSLGEDDKRYLSQLFRDEKGPIPEIYRMF